MDVDKQATEGEKTRKHEGKFNDLVRLNILITDDTDAEVMRICEKLKMTKTDAVVEALWFWINSLRARGV